MMFLSKNWYFSVQKALIYYTVNKSHHNSFILLVLSHVANFRYVANFRFLTLQGPGQYTIDFILEMLHNQIWISVSWPRQKSGVFESSYYYLDLKISSTWSMK